MVLSGLMLTWAEAPAAPAIIRAAVPAMAPLAEMARRKMDLFMEMPFGVRSPLRGRTEVRVETRHVTAAIERTRASAVRG